MELTEWKELKKKVEENQLNERDIYQLIENDMIEVPFTEEQIASQEEDTSMTQHYQKVMRHPSIPSTSPELYENNEKSGFSNAVLLAIISFISEILFIGLTILLYK